MRISKIVLGVFAVALTFGAANGAFAAHGKAGLWSVDMTIAGQDTSKLPASVIQHMKAKGLTPNSNGGFTLMRCMMATEVADDSKMLDTHANQSCELVNRKNTGHAASADLVCKGQIEGTGRVSVEYDSDTHYSGEMLINAQSPDGTPVKQDQKFVGRWISASCTTAH
jgi:hypothetical protein